MNKSLFAIAPSRLRTFVPCNGTTSSLQGWYESFGPGNASGGEWRDITQREAAQCINQHVQIVHENSAGSPA